MQRNADIGFFTNPSKIDKNYVALVIHCSSFDPYFTEVRFANNPLVTYAVQEHLQLSIVSKYDLIFSAPSIHHLEHPDKQDLFRKIDCALRPGGVFINADQALAPTPHGEDEKKRQWLMDVTAAGVSRPSLEQARERMREDRNALLSDQLAWLSEAGFDNVDCWYKRFRFVVYGGTKMIE